VGGADGGVDDQQGDVGFPRAANARSTEYDSGPRSVFDRRRMPAVSTKHSGPSSVSTTVSMVSRVVPGMSCTTARSSPMSRLNSVDLPTLGRPTSATRGGRPSSDTSSPSSGA